MHWNRYVGMMWMWMEMCCLVVSRYEGMRGFYKGLWPNVLRVTPACCVTFLVYEKTVSMLRSHTQRTQPTQAPPSTLQPPQSSQQQQPQQPQPLQAQQPHSQRSSLHPAQPATPACDNVPVPASVASVAAQHASHWMCPGGVLWGPCASRSQGSTVTSSSQHFFSPFRSWILLFRTLHFSDAYNADFLELLIYVHVVVILFDRFHFNNTFELTCPVVSLKLIFQFSQ